MNKFRNSIKYHRLFVFPLAFLLFWVSVLPAWAVSINLTLSDTERWMVNGGNRMVTAQVYDGDQDITDAVYNDIHWRVTPTSLTFTVDKAYLNISSPTDWERDEQPVVIEVVYGDSSARQIIWAARNIPLVKALQSRKLIQEASGKLSDDDIIAIATAGEDPSGPLWQKSGNSPITYRKNNTGDLTTTGKKAKLLLALALAKSVAMPGSEADGIDLTDFGPAHLNLVDELVSAQSTAEDATKGRIGTDSGSEWGEAWVTNHSLAVLALKAAEEQGVIMPAGYNKSDARAWLLRVQTADGGWGWDGGAYADPDSTALALRALVALGESDKSDGTPLKKGLDYLKSKQNTDGGFSSFWSPDSSGDTTAQVLLALAATGENPTGEAWRREGKSGVDYLLAIQQADGSWDSSDVFTPGDAIAALAKAGLSRKSLVFAPSGQGGPGGGGQPVSEPDQCTVEIAVRGMNNELLYWGSVTVSKNGRWGCTALGALDATGLDYVVEENGFVKSIAGQANSGMKGWMYKVGRAGRWEVPNVSARDWVVKEGDQIIWWYSTDMNSPGPDWDSLLKGSATVAAETKTTENLPPALQPSKEASEALNKLAQLLGLKQDTTELGPLGEAVKTVAVVGGDKLPVRAEIATLKKELTENIIDLTQKIEAAKGANIFDALGEIALSIPANALENDIAVTIKEEAAVSGTAGLEGSGGPLMPDSYRLLSPVYNFGPDGTTFTTPATLILKVTLTPLSRPENLVLAWYDKAGGRWVAIPAVFDAAKQMVIARINHFSVFAVMYREEKKSFNDVSASSCGWAQEAVEVLAGAGIIAGVDGINYEPERAVTRAELASIMVKALNLQAADGSTTFKDVPGNQWYYGCVTAAAKEGLLKGYEDGTFCPDRAITREELAAVLVRTLGLKSPSGTELPFTDAGEVSDWAKDSVAVAASAGLVKGYPGGAFEPHGTVTRAECAVMIYRVLVDF